LNRLLSILILATSFQAFSGTWIKKSNFGGVGRHRAVGGSVNNRGYLGLGHVNGTGVDISYKDWWEYDPSSDSWTQRADFPVPNHGAIAFSAIECIFVGGGSALNGEFYKYNPLTNSWSPTAACPISPGDIQAFSVNDKGYVISGNSLVEYNAMNNSWQTKSNVPVAVNAWSASFSIGSSGFVKTGVNFFEYKPGEDTWIVRSSFPGLSSGGSYGFAADDEGYITCGYFSGLSNVTDEVWKFNPALNEWLQVEIFPGTNRRFPVAFSINGKGYFGTGTNGINMNDFWQYDPSFTLGIEDLIDVSVNVYPNPFVENLTIQLDSQLSEIGLTYHVTDLTGKLVKSGQIDSEKVHLSMIDTNPGTYIVSLFYGDKKIKDLKVIQI
jgi:N-acetylneuraminic acid mutarotase